MTSVSPKTPLVSVLTTCYNREAYIAETIESVLAQTMSDFEYIIVDDCSKDRSFEIAQSYARKDSRIRVYRNEANLGDYPNRNKAASYATGKYLKYIDSDDILYPHALDVMIRCMEQFQEAALGLVKVHSQQQSLPVCLTAQDAYVEHHLGKGLFGNAPGSVIIKRQEFESEGRFSGQRYIGDYECWLKLGRKYPVVLIPAYLGWDRKHDVQESNLNEAEYEVLRFHVASAALTKTDCPLSENQVAQAKTKMRQGHAKLVLHYWLVRRSWSSGLRILKGTDCCWSDLLKVIVRKCLSSS